jgi:hypothetical protein
LCAAEVAASSSHGNPNYNGQVDGRWRFEYTTLPFTFWCCIIHEEFERTREMQGEIRKQEFDQIFFEAAEIPYLLTTENRHYFIAEYLFILENEVRTVSNI